MSVQVRLVDGTSAQNPVMLEPMHISASLKRTDLNEML